MSVGESSGQAKQMSIFVGVTAGVKKEVWGHVPEREVEEEERAEYDREPQVPQRGLAEDGSEPENVSDLVQPDLRAVNTRDDHDAACDDEALGGAVEVAQVQDVRVEGFPGREP